MKKLFILLLVLSSIACRAEWLKTVITLKDNTTKEGYIKNFKNNTTRKIAFKPDLQSKAQSLRSIDVKRLEMKFKKGGKLVLYYLHPANLVSFSYVKVKISKKWMWFTASYEGDFNLLSATETMNFNYSSNGMHSSASFQYNYINWPEDDYAMLTEIHGSGASVTIGGGKYLRETNKLIFKGRCDKMTDAITKKTFKPKKITDIVEFYEKNCSSKSATGDSGTQPK
jgi:hypothetical protein